MNKLSEWVMLVAAPWEGIVLITRSARSALTTQPWLSKDDVS